MPQNNVPKHLKHSPWIAQDAIQLHRLFADNPQTAIAQLAQHPQLQEMLMELLRQSSRYAKTINRYVIATTTDLNGKISTVSQAFCELTGYTADELIGQTHSLLKHSETPPSVYQNLWETITSGESWHGELRGLRKSGESFWVEMHIDPIIDTEGNNLGYIAIRHDITQRKLIEQMSITDELTGSYNRRHFNRLFPEEIKRAKRENHWLVFLMCDADQFKKYNDTYGHQAGDEVLISVAQVLKQVFHRASDHIFRLGGEEFGVLFTVQQPEHVTILVEKIFQILAEKNIEHSGNPPHNKVTLSMGIMAIDPALDYVTEEIYKYADEALYRAKNKGRNNYVLVDMNSTPEVEFF
ncbi:MAG: diguanylate cyclase [Gammaproteobacteria bacterium]|nr:diguanylate cyclase [Gammaproteobacteria bacterium]